MDSNTFDKTMTVFYSKTTGKIKALCQGEQSFDFFTDEKEDMELILNRLVTEYKEQVMRNWDFYIVKDNQIVLNEDYINTLRE